MARCEHLPIFKKAYELALRIEQEVQGFSRYHKYALGQDLRELSCSILRQLVRINSTRDRLL